MAITVHVVPVTPFMQNARIVRDDATGETAVVDPGGDVPVLTEALEAIGREGGVPSTVVAVWLTHAHLDHAGGVEQLLRAIEAKQGTRPPLVGHREERDLRARIPDQAFLFGLPPDEFDRCPEPTRYVDDGDTVDLGAHRGTVLFTPGHSPGHISIAFPKTAIRRVFHLPGRPAIEDRASAPFVIAGDTLFEQSVGRTDLPGGNASVLKRSIETKLLTLDDETIVMPGHGGDTTIGRERRTNPFLQGGFNLF